GADGDRVGVVGLDFGGECHPLDGGEVRRVGGDEDDLPPLAGTEVGDVDVPADRVGVGAGELVGLPVVVVVGGEPGDRVAGRVADGGHPVVLADVEVLVVEVAVDRSLRVGAVAGEVVVAGPLGLRD